MYSTILNQNQSSHWFI